MKVDEIVLWMLDKLKKDQCLYQDDVVDFLVKRDLMSYLKENTAGNLVLKLSINSAFKKQTIDNIVWVKPDRYCRYTVAEDESGRESRG